MDAEKLWSKNFIVSTISCFFASMVLYMTVTTFAVYTSEKYDVPLSAAGFIASIFLIGGAFGRITSGKVADTKLRKKFTLAVSILFFLFSLLYFVDTSFILLFVIRFIHGFTFGAFHNSLSTIVVTFIPKKRLGEGLAIFSLNFVLSTAIGPFVGSMIMNNFSATVMFIVCSASGLVSLLLVLLVEIRPPAFLKEIEDTPKEKESLFSMFFEKKVLPLSFMIIIMSMCYTGITAFMNSYMAAIDLSKYAPFFFIVYAASILIVRPMAGKRLDRQGDNAVVIPAILFYIVSLLMLSAVGLTKIPAFIFVAAILLSLGFGTVLNIGQSISVKQVPMNKIAKANSTYFVFSDIGMGLGPLLMGFVVAATSFPKMYLVEAGLVVLSLVIYYYLHGRKVKKQTH